MDRKLSLDIQQDIPLAPYTTFKIGGPARFFCEVATEEELIDAIVYAREQTLKIFVLGGGSNVVISDSGFPGLVIRMLLEWHETHDTSIACGSGAWLSQIVSEATGKNLTGLEWASGIPGSVGGAVRGNAGAYGGCMGDVVTQIRVLDTKSLQLRDYSNQDCQFAYRDSFFKQNPDLVIVSGVLNLQQGNSEDIKNKVGEILQKRGDKLPTDPSPGSFFQNPTVKDTELIERFEKEVGQPCRGNKLPAGWLIDEVGFRGKNVGGVQVSEKHGNFVVNNGSGSAQDVVMLASLIKQKVRTELKVQLIEEVQYIGF